ncbi:MAG: M6 family metalloprotease domain-containing protein [Halieaceae bacterium]|nr:M6 family metalloprotease domain-containing protein [Halieaceae bacterium]
MVENLASFRFDQLGHPQIQSDSIQPVLASSARPHKLLILPIRFADKGYDRFVGDPAQDDKNREYFQQLLFAGGAKSPQAGTLSHYYNHQSRGLYNVTGDIFSVVELSKPLAYYGRPVQSSDGSWRSDENPTRLVVDALQSAYAAQPDFPWQDYDQWDPKDFDGDGNRDEPDGYLDHFVLIVAGKGQASCQGLYNLGEKLNVNAKADAFFGLTADEQACADRIWPHRFTLSQNLGKGPTVGGQANTQGGVDIGNGMWVLDYNMQSEYTDVATFIHEFGHSVGLPDVYARQTNNSTGSWEAMSGTASPQPQELSSWARMVLGWMQPCVIRPGDLGGEKQGSLVLKTMNDWSGVTGEATGKGVCDAAMVVLPPKFRDIELGPLTSRNGAQALYSGQGNGMNRSLSRRFDLRSVAKDVPVLMNLDTWFVIEAEWDYLYVEAATPEQDFHRLMPTDKTAVGDNESVMPSAKGHEGKGTRPGFTGRSGDLDGDGKVETAENCNPQEQRTLAEDKIGRVDVDPCESAQWVSAEFDLSAYRGQQVTLRFTYFTDMAAVEDGALLDNIAIPAIGFSEDFEGDSLAGWDVEGFTLSNGSHHLAVPHFYLLEYRDPYAEFSNVKNYDAGLSHPGFQFFPDGRGGMQAFNVNYRPGVVMWYYNGEYLWSQNEPAESGPGNGFLLVVDSNPQEFELPNLPANYYKRDGNWSYWAFDEAAQPMLRDAYVDTMCFQRRASYYSTDVASEEMKRCKDALRDGLPEMESLSWNERPLMYGYTIANELLPGPERQARKSASTLFDLRIREGKTQYRLYDRALRNLHSADAPFALQPFANGVEFYKGVNGEMMRQSATAFAPVSEFSDARPNRYQNPKLPFGGAAIPEAGFSYALKEPGAQAPAGSKVRVEFRWR